MMKKARYKLIDDLVLAGCNHLCVTNFIEDDHKRGESAIVVVTYKSSESV